MSDKPQNVYATSPGVYHVGVDLSLHGIDKWVIVTVVIKDEKLVLDKITYKLVNTK